MKQLGLFLSCLVLVAGGQLHAKLITVGPSGGYDHTAVTAALAVAANGDTVRVAPGTYSVITGEVFPLVIRNAITLEWATSGVQPWLQGDTNHTVLLVASADVTVRGFRITDGFGSEGIYGMDGGGICIFVDQDASGSVLITDCLIENNSCPYDETYDGCGGGVYCGGTWCTCFEIGITNCVIGGNVIPGNGGGVFCGLLSKVWIEGCTVTNNSAQDRGGGVYVDNYSLAMLKNSRVLQNDSPGDPSRADWGGKGGGAFCHGEAVLTITGCNLVGNSARYYGGGLFTMSPLVEAGTGGECTNGAQRFFTMPVLSNIVSGSLLARNSAGISGGGAYIRDHSFEAFFNTTNYWNDATEDGGGVCVSGTAGGGGQVVFTGRCLIEGNECAGRGGGVFLGTRSQGLFEDTRFLGNSSDRDGGAVFLGNLASASLTNCLVTYNNSARSHGGAFRLLANARAQLEHCTVVGNFAPWGRSGFYLGTNALLTVTNSILWRNAGGSVDTNLGLLQIDFCLDEDGAAPLTGNPGLVGWGANADVFVDAAATGSGSGTAADPYHDLQLALDGFDFRLASGSPCIGAASDGGNLGAATGAGGTAGHVLGVLRLAPGSYDIRGRNFAMLGDANGAEPGTSVIYNSVMGYVENGRLSDFRITGEQLFGGLVIRGNPLLTNCVVYGNHALEQGGGLFLCEQCRIEVDATRFEANSAGASGGGAFLNAGVQATFRQSRFEGNLSAMEGGGLYAAQSITTFTNCSLSGNQADGFGGGFRQAGGSAEMSDCEVVGNSAGDRGGGICSSGTLGLYYCLLAENTVIGKGAQGGGVYLAPDAQGLVHNCFLLWNGAEMAGGAIATYCWTRVYDCWFSENTANEGGAVLMCHADTPDYFERCLFERNRSSWRAGAVQGNAGVVGVFSLCTFDGNQGTDGGAALLFERSQVVFDQSVFTNNLARSWGGAAMLISTRSLFTDCQFDLNYCLHRGGSLSFHGSDTTRVLDCELRESRAADWGGAAMVNDSSTPVFRRSSFQDCRAGANGGAVACSHSTAAAFTEVQLSTCAAKLGGGFYADGGNHGLERCRFFDNAAYSATESADGGGAHFTVNATGRLLGCDFRGNSASDDGGAMSIQSLARVFVTNCLFHANEATNTGGALHFTHQSRGTLRNSTIATNIAKVSNGGGIYLESQCTLSLESVVLAGNLPDGISPGGIVTADYSSLQEAASGKGNLLANPLLAPVTLWLQPGSPCIDTGNPEPFWNDAERPPALGSVTNDMGAFGGPLNGSLSPQPAGTPIPAGSAWHFYSSETPLTGMWTDPAFDDSAWPIGVARLGFGNDGEATQVAFGPDSLNKPITYWFRRTFVLADPGTVLKLNAAVTFDDGLCVYLNGTEILRRYLPAGPLSPATRATANLQGTAETAWTSFPIAPGMLRPGTNVIAVEVHLCASADEDFGFDFELEAGFSARPLTSRPVLRFSDQTGLGFSSVSGQSYTLLASTNLADWVVVTNCVGTGAFMQLRDPTTPLPALRFYKLRLP